jgi:hypothetical protein
MLPLSLFPIIMMNGVHLTINLPLKTDPFHHIGIDWNMILLPSLLKPTSFAL